ncbi:MAG: 30S ribosomal protein S13 [Planctomycetota bacterium]
MARVVGVDIPNEKRTVIALTYVHGIGTTTAQAICKQAGIDPSLRAKELTDDELSRLGGVIENNYTVEGALRRQVQQNIGRLRDIGCYRGLRHRRGLPVRGQRTRTNARTRKGPKRIVAKKKGLK